MSEYEIVAVGNAIVDILARVDENFLKKHGLVKGSMTLIAEEAANKLYDETNNAILVSGGSAANTIAGIASLGGKSAFIGKVFADKLGEIFTHDLRSLGVYYKTKMAESGASTARSFVVVTPDAQRTMSTFLGATSQINIDDIDDAIIANAKITYLEGYLWDEVNAKNAMRAALDIAKKNKRKVAFSLSDPFCVNRHKKEFMGLIEEGVDILFSNEEEILALTDKDNVADAINFIGKKCSIACVTLGEKGALAIANGNIYKIDALKDVDVVDTTGAGDLFAAGFLYGLIKEKNIDDCLLLGVIAAGEVISHLGARPEVNLQEYVQKKWR